MQGRMYTAIFRSVTVGALQDLFEISAAAGVPVWVHEIFLTCRSGNDERLNIMVHRATTSGSGGTTATPSGVNTSVVADTVVEINNTTQGGDGVIVGSGEWDLRMPYQRLPVPAGKVLIEGGGRLCVSLETAPAAARIMTGEILIEEVDR